jgi:hypothetical protein
MSSMKRFPLTVWLFAIFIALLTTLPHLIALMNTPQGWQYSGALPVPAGFRVDYNSHLAKMWQGSRGEFAYQLLFTHEDHPALPTVQGFYVVLGAFAGLFNLNFALVYHLARIILIVIMILTLWRFAAYFFTKNSERWLVLLFATLAAGWGWLALPFTRDIAPIEFWLIDAYNLIGAIYMPHFVAAISLQMVAMLTFEAWRKQPEPYHLPVLTLTLFLDAIIQPYVVLLTFPLFGLLTLYHCFIGKTLPIKRALLLIIPALAHGGIVIYQYALIQGNPIWADFTAQNITLSPPPVLYILGYLPFLLPILWGIKPLWCATRHDERWLVPVLWVLLALILLYMPIATQRRYLLGVQTPLAVLAAFGWMQSVRFRRANLLLIPYLALAFIAPLLLIMGNMLAFASVEANAAVYYSADELQAANWIEENAPSDALLLTTFNPDERGTGGMVVALTGRRVFSGHWIETAFYDSKTQQIATFYNAITSDGERQLLLDEIDADYIWYDSEAQATGAWQPASVDYLQQVFASETVVIYEVIE